MIGQKDGLAGNWGRSEMKKNGGHMDGLKFTQREREAREHLGCACLQSWLAFRLRA